MWASNVATEVAEIFEGLTPENIFVATCEAIRSRVLAQKREAYKFTSQRVIASAKRRAEADPGKERERRRRDATRNVARRCREYRARKKLRLIEQAARSRHVAGLGM